MHCYITPCFIFLCASFSDCLISYLSVTDVELKRLRDAFRRTCGLSSYMSQQCFFKEVLGDMVPLNICEVNPVQISGVCSWCRASEFFLCKVVKYDLFVCRACGMRLCMFQHVIIACSGFQLNAFLSKKVTLSIGTVTSLTACSSVFIYIMRLEGRLVMNYHS